MAVAVAAVTVRVTVPMNGRMTAGMAPPVTAVRGRGPVLAVRGLRGSPRRDARARARTVTGTRVVDGVGVRGPADSVATAVTGAP